MGADDMRGHLKISLSHRERVPQAGEGLGEASYGRAPGPLTPALSRWEREKSMKRFARALFEALLTLWLLATLCFALLHAAPLSL